MHCSCESIGAMPSKGIFEINSVVLNSKILSEYMTYYLSLLIELQQSINFFFF